MMIDIPKKYIAVFCGSSAGTEPLFMQEAVRIGQMIARQGYGIVYGGAKVGLMGAMANAALHEGGEVIGVIPTFLKQKEIVHTQLSKIHTVDSMHQRKALMNELCDAFVALPGGYGTMEELFEILTWSQLGLHQKPIGLLNSNGFYNGLISMLEEMTIKGFLKQENKDLLLIDSNVNTLLHKIETAISLCPQQEVTVSI